MKFILKNHLMYYTFFTEKWDMFNDNLKKNYLMSQE